MKRILNIGAFVLTLLCLAGPAAATGCDRPCLERVLDRYFAHVIDRRPDRTLLAPHPNIRENTLAVALDRGVWASIRTKRAGLTFADPEAGQIAYAGAFETRAGTLTPLFVRLRVERGRVAESEVAYNTGPNRFFHPEELLEPDVLYDAVVPKARRSTRAGLIAVAQAYLDGIGASQRCLFRRHRNSSKVTLRGRCDQSRWQGSG